MRKWSEILLFFVIATTVLAGWWLRQRDASNSRAWSKTVQPAHPALQNRTPTDVSTEKIPGHSVPQDAPCVGQPRSGKELAASFQKARFPSASELDGTWVEIGSVQDGPTSQFRSLNCSGEKQGGKLQFAVVASGYSVELYAMGDNPQKVTMKSDGKGSVEFPLDEGADEGPVPFRCRLTDRDTLACLNSPYGGVELKKMEAESTQIYIPAGH